MYNDCMQSVAIFYSDIISCLFRLIIGQLTGHIVANMLIYLPPAAFARLRTSAIVHVNRLFYKICTINRKTPVAGQYSEPDSA